MSPSTLCCTSLRRIRNSGKMHLATHAEMRFCSHPPRGFFVVNTRLWEHIMTTKSCLNGERRQEGLLFRILREFVCVCVHINRSSLCKNPLSFYDDNNTLQSQSHGTVSMHTRISSNVPVQLRNLLIQMSKP